MTNPGTKGWLLLAGLALGISPVRLPLAAAEIRLKPVAHCSAPVVRLGDVAEIRDEEQPAKLAQIVLLPAPSTGRSRELRVQEVRELLSLHGIDLRAHRLEGARRVQVQGPVSAPAAAAAAAEPQLATALVAARAVARGEVLGPADVRAASVPAAQAVPLELEDVLGMEVAAPLQAGQVLDSQKLRRPLRVRRNSMITVTSRAAGVVVRTQAKALDDGALGDVVLLESIPHRQKFSARVVDYDRADVYASGVSVAPAPAPPSRPSSHP